MATGPEQWDQWLDQGYVEIEGWAPANDWQSQVAQQYGLALGPDNPQGLERRPGGGGLPFSREAPGGRTYRVPIGSKEDILEYLEFVNKMGANRRDRLRQVHGTGYTGEDIVNYFIRPQEEARIEAAKERTGAAMDRGRRMAASESARMAESALGSVPGIQDYAIAGMGSPGGGLAEEAYIASLRDITSAIESSPTRLKPLDDLRQAGIEGYGQNIALNETIAEVGKGIVDAGSGLAAGTPVLGTAIGGVTQLVGAPFAIGGADQARRYREALTNLVGSESSGFTGGRLAAPAMTTWSSRMPVSGRQSQTLAPVASMEDTLGGMYKGGSKGGSGYVFG